MVKFSGAKILALCLSALYFVIPFPLIARDHPVQHKVGLALSGGGARGAAHLGVLRVLEREGIRVDCIAGTSFGAIVGGLYALGYSTSEIEQIFTMQEWENLFRNIPERRLTPLTENRNYRYQAQLDFAGLSPELPNGLSSGQKIIEALNFLTTTRILATGDDFDHLPIPFRAVATDLVTGQPYVFRNGRMTEALRASIGIPLLFTPLEKDNMMLVDGGLSDNLPTDIVRDMGADVIIAVDVTEPLMKKGEIRSFVDVVDQSISILMKKSVDANRSLASIVIQPDLEGFAHSDFLRLGEIVDRGAEETEKQLVELHRLTDGVSPRQPGLLPLPVVKPVIDSITFEGLERVDGRRLTNEIKSKPGREAKAETMRADLTRLYATRLFSHADCELTPEDKGGYRLTYLLKEAPPHTLGASIRYDRDDKLIALVEGTARRLFGTPSSATISTQFGGIDNDYASFRFSPSGVPFIFLEPRIFFTRRDRSDIRDGQLVDRFTDKRIGGQLALGGTLFKRLEALVAYRDENVTIGGGAAPYRLDGSVREAGLMLRVTRDTLDAPDFPRTGSAFHFQADKRSQVLGGDVSHSKYQAEVERYVSFSDVSTITLRANGGYSRGVLPFFERYYAGGFSYSETGPWRFIGFDRDELAGSQLGLVALGYRRQLFSHPLSFTRRGFISIEYNGAGISDQRSSPYNFVFRSGAGIGLALDTLIGPLRVVGAWGEGGRAKFYLSFGPGF